MGDFHYHAATMERQGCDHCCVTIANQSRDVGVGHDFFSFAVVNRTNRALPESTD
jgi:hypothetical protein